MTFPAEPRKSPAPQAGQERRYAQLHVRVDVLLSLLAEGRQWRVAEDGLPDDAELVHWRIEDGGWLVLVLRSLGFVPLGPHDPIPQLRPTQLESVHGP